MIFLLFNVYLLVRFLKRLCYNFFRILNFNCMINKWWDVFLVIVYIKLVVVVFIYWKIIRFNSMCKIYRFF